MTKAYRFIDALYRKPVDRTPIWIMRQAGRYLPEYRELRKQHPDFLSMCKNPDVACEITLMPIARYPLDAAIIFSDILTVPEAMGLDLHFESGVGPVFSNPIRDPKAVDNLIIPDANGELGYVMDAIRTTRSALDENVPLIGFSGSPWTLAAYMLEGKGSKTFSVAKKFLYQEPEAMHKLLDKLAQSIGAYLNAQIEAGAQAVMIFDTWGGMLTPATYQAFSLNYMQQVLATLPSNQKTPTILFTKQGGHWLEAQAATGTNALGVDWTIDIGQARARVGHKVALQGNLDPCVLYAPPAKIEEAVSQLLQSFGHHEGHVMNLGHGIYPDVDPEHVSCLIEAVARLSPQYHGA